MVPVDFGPIVHSVTVDKAVIAFLMRWLPTWLRVTEDREGLPNSTLARPASYATTYDEDDEDFFSDRRLPCTFVTAGEALNWTRTGAGDYCAYFRTRITTVSRGRNKAEARYQSAMYCAAITELLISKPALDGICNGVEVISERPRPITDPSNRSRNLSGGFGEYLLYIPNLRAARSGPLTPDPPGPDDPLVPLPDVADVQVTYGFESPSTTPLED